MKDNLKKARELRNLGNQGNGISVSLEIFDLMAQAYEDKVKELGEEIANVRRKFAYNMGKEVD